MKIDLHQVPLREIVEGYRDDAEAGVVAYDGHLDVRPPYQREFVYKDKQRDAVIDTVFKGFPLNVSTGSSRTTAASRSSTVSSARSLSASTRRATFL